MKSVRWALSMLVWLGAATGQAFAGGEVVLPLAGIAVDLPARAGLGYEVTGSWKLDGMAFEGGDTIDELRAGKVVATTWVSVGWFEVGGCLDVLRYAPIEAPWELPKVALWGTRWAARGGIYRGGSEMDGRPVVTLCLERGERKQLVLSRFPIEAVASGGTTQRAQLLREVRRSEVLRRIYRSFAKDRTVVTAPARDARNRGEIAAQREVTMLWSEVTLTLPDDGFVWVTGADLAGVDRFERMAPALPELSLAVARVDAPMTCRGDGLALVGGQALARPPTGLPAGWEAGPTSVGARCIAASARVARSRGACWWSGSSAGRRRSTTVRSRRCSRRSWAAPGRSTAPRAPERRCRRGWLRSWRSHGARPTSIQSRPCSLRW